MSTTAKISELVDEPGDTRPLDLGTQIFWTVVICASIKFAPQIAGVMVTLSGGVM